MRAAGYRFIINSSVFQVLIVHILTNVLCFFQSDDQAKEEILAFFGSHVTAVSAIYKRTIFQTYDGNLQNGGLGFVIHRSTVSFSHCIGLIVYTFGP
jgi:hypothetical protein